MRIYLDNCSLNRPFDHQGQLRIRLETEAKLAIQQAVLDSKIELVWSYVLDMENESNPFNDRRTTIAPWKARAIEDVEAAPEILDKGRELQSLGLKAKDALHVSCAIRSACRFFITTDDDIIRKNNIITEIVIINPIDFIREQHHDN